MTKYENVLKVMMLSSNLSEVIDVHVTWSSIIYQREKQNNVTH